MKTTLIIVVIVAIGSMAYFIFQKPAEKREGEITVGDLVEESKSRVPGTTAIDGKKTPGTSIMPAVYDGTHLVSVPASDQELIRRGGAEVQFKTYIPSKIPTGFSLRQASVSNGMQNGVSLFQAIFSHKNGDNIFVYQYPLSEYLASGGMTLAEYTKNVVAIDADGKKAYISGITVTTARKYQYHQTITVVDDATLVRIEYSGEEKLSNSDLTALASSLVR